MPRHLWRACVDTVQAHQGFLRAFNSVTNSTAHKNNILKAWKDMSNVPPEKVTRYEILITQGVSICFSPLSVMVCELHVKPPALAAESGSVPEQPQPMCRVLCAGFSLGAALATMCGPWAKVTFPNVGCRLLSANSSPLPFSAPTCHRDESFMGEHLEDQAVALRSTL